MRTKSVRKDKPGRGIVIRLRGDVTGLLLKTAHIRGLPPGRVAFIVDEALRYGIRHCPSVPKEVRDLATKAQEGDTHS